MAAAAVARGQWGIVAASQYGDNTGTPLHLTLQGTVYPPRPASLVITASDVGHGPGAELDCGAALSSPIRQHVSSPDARIQVTVH